MKNKEIEMSKKITKVVSVPDYWLLKFQSVVEELAKLECYCADMESELHELVEVLMAQGKMMEEAGLQPLTPEIFMTMAKCLDAKERELSKREESFKRKFGGFIPDKKEWN